MIIIGVILGISIYLIFFQKDNSSGPDSLESLKAITLKRSDNSLEKRIENLETAVDLLIKQVVKISSGSGDKSTTQTSSDSDAGVSVLEKRVQDLETKISSLQQTPSFQSSGTTGTPVYIPLGSGGNSNDRNYVSTGTYQVSVDPADYPGYKNMQLEVSMKFTNEVVGVANVRLYNLTDKAAITGSNASANSNIFNFYTSSVFTLPAGNKTYQMQTQSTEGYDVTLGSARIKVNF